VEGRIAALARVHTILSLSSWEGAELTGLIEEELAPFATREARVAATGPKVQLTPATAQTLALALHELATNAAKYGALSALDGRISVNWKLDQDVLDLEWKEHAGPKVQKPASRGFGTRSVIASIETQLGGRASFDWRPEGLLCQLTVPLAEQPEMEQPDLQQTSPQDQPAAPGQGNGKASFAADRRLHGRAIG